MTDSLFETDQSQAARFEDLVGEGKKYKTTDDAAKALIEKDRFIAQLQAEGATFREEIKARLSLEELADRIARQTPNGEPSPTQRSEPGSPQAEPAPTDLKAEVKRLLEEERSTQNRQSNLEKSKQAAKERFGGDYNATLRQIAEELSVSDKFLTDMAASSPAAFIKLIDSVKTPDNNRSFAPPSGSVDTSKNFNTQVRRNKAYFDNLRKTDLNGYLSKRVQNEMHREAMAQGQAFYE